jgi:N-acetylmuramoyl-L-alanine amidase
MNQFFTFLILILLSFKTWSFTILIDPGHGGEDDGAKVGVKLKTEEVIIKEKDIALQIATKIYDLLSPKYNVFLTRSVDRTVTLPERAQIAEKVKADLFISIHINSSPDGSAVGFETYYLDNNNDVAVKKVEKTENIQPSGEEIVQQILVDLVVEQTVATSKPLAVSIHSEIKKNISGKYHIPSRGIKPGLFYVLALSKRPGVLLEVGFVSTQKERIRMQNPVFQNDYAHAVAIGIEKFINSKNKIVLSKKKPRHKSRH